MKKKSKIPKADSMAITLFDSLGTMGRVLSLERGDGKPEVRKSRTQEEKDKAKEIKNWNDAMTLAALVRKHKKLADKARERASNVEHKS